MTTVRHKSAGRDLTRSGRDGGGSDGSGLHDVLGSSGNVGGGRLGDGLVSSNHILVPGDHTGLSGLDGPVSDHSVLHSVLDHWGAGSVAAVGLAHHSGGGGHRGGDEGSGSVSAGHEAGGGQVGGSSHGHSQAGE